VVFPLKDTLPGEGPPSATLGLLAGVAGATLLALGAGWDVTTGDVVLLAASLLALWIFGAALEDALGAATYAGLALLGAAVATGLARALGGEADVLTAVVGATGVVVAGRLRVHPDARVLCASFVPLAFTMLEVPAIALAALYAVLAVLTTPTATDAGLALAVATGAVTVRLLSPAPRRAPAPYRVD
jgi:membrane associated rhomboid family serine protease